MDKEEGEVFPLYRSADPASLAKIHELEEEHQEAGRLLAEMRRLAHNYQLPPHACNTLKLAWSELENLEADMHLHVFKENHYLFPRK